MKMTELRSITHCMYVYIYIYIFKNENNNKQTIVLGLQSREELPGHLHALNTIKITVLQSFQYANVCTVHVPYSVCESELYNTTNGLRWIPNTWNVVSIVYNCRAYPRD